MALTSSPARTGKKTSSVLISATHSEQLTKPIGNRMPPKHIGYRRSSGCMSLPASMRFAYTLVENCYHRSTSAAFLPSSQGAHREVDTGRCKASKENGYERQCADQSIVASLLLVYDRYSCEEEVEDAAANRLRSASAYSSKVAFTYNAKLLYVTIQVVIGSRAIMRSGKMRFFFAKDLIETGCISWRE